MECDSINTIVTIACTIATTFAAIVALVISCQANRISKKQYRFSSKPIIECYLATYKTDRGSPYIVLVIENHGSLTARNINITVNYPSGINNADFNKYATRLGKTPFTLAPHTKLSTPICWNENMNSIVNGIIKIKGNFSYFDIDNKCQKDEIPQAELTVDEFNLFNAINMVGENNNGQA